MTIESLLPYFSSKTSSDDLETLTNAWIWCLIIIFLLSLILWLVSYEVVPGNGARGLLMN